MKKLPNIYLGLVHYPINNKNGEIVTTSVTNLDIHDISRSCRTFGVTKYFIVTPLQAQHELVGRILGHWEGDKSGCYNPDRKDALSIARLSKSVDDAVMSIKEAEGVEPIIVVTGANFKEFSGNENSLREKMSLDNRPCLLLFGTGWGLNAAVLDRADFSLGPIFSSAEDDYNHLSVRSAVAIYLDRIRRGL